MGHELMEHLARDAERLARRFGLAYRRLEAERPQVKRRYGVCFADGTIRIRLHHAVSRRPLKYSSLVNTLCHELAHLRHFNHGPRFKAFYLAILDYARSQGIYRPGPERCRAAPRAQERRQAPARTAGSPEQLRLFGI
jgi:predicted metal-dependent hydrolase